MLQVGAHQAAVVLQTAAVHRRCTCCNLIRLFLPTTSDMAFCVSQVPETDTLLVIKEESRHGGASLTWDRGSQTLTVARAASAAHLQRHDASCRSPSPQLMATAALACRPLPPRPPGAEAV